MSTISTTHLSSGQKPLLRSIALGGMYVFVIQAIVQEWFVYSVLQGTPFILVMQYLASGALGNSAFDGGITTALLGVFFHLLVSFVVAGVFILSGDRIPLLSRYPIPGSLLYGFGVFIVMNLVVLPLSAAPPIPAPSMPWLIEAIIETMLLVGLPLGILLRRNSSIKV
jgi:hypothetical protein